MADGFYKDLIKELARLGYLFHTSAKGSHEKWKHGMSGKVLLVPHNLYSRHTANGILKDAGSTHKF